MISTLDLLRLSPIDALRAIVQDQLVDGTDIGPMTIVSVEETGETLTRATISIDRGISALKYWKYNGSHDVLYNRLNLSAVFGDLGIVVETSLPTTRHAIIKRLFSKSGIFFDPTEFLDGIVLETDTTFTIKAVLSSARWVGSVAMGLVRKVAVLADSVSVTELYNALNYNTSTNVYSGSAKYNLVRQLIVENGLNIKLPFDENDFELSDIVKTSNFDDRVNTTATITILNSDVYSGSVAVTYRRLNLAKVSDYQNVTVNSTNILTTYDLAVLAAKELGIRFNYEDIIEEPVPYLMTGQFVDVSIFASVDSPMYVSELTVEWHKTQPQ
jgi:hypothetical protein